MPNTSDFIRKVLQDSFSDTVPCEMCQKKSPEKVFDHGGSPLTSASESLLTQKFQKILPRLSTDLAKGACGRIAVFAGCHLYTGYRSILCAADIQIVLSLNFVVLPSNRRTKDINSVENMTDLFMTKSYIDLSRRSMLGFHSCIKDRGRCGPCVL